MRCEVTQDVMSEYVGELPSRVNTHIERCEPCSTEFAYFAELNDSLADMADASIEAPHQLLGLLLDQVSDTRNPESQVEAQPNTHLARAKALLARLVPYDGKSVAVTTATVGTLAWLVKKALKHRIA